MTEEQLIEYEHEREVELQKIIDHFDFVSPEKQWAWVELYREEGELIIDKDSTRFIQDCDGASIELKLKEQCSMETLLRTFGFNYKINTND